MRTAEPALSRVQKQALSLSRMSPRTAAMTAGYAGVSGSMMSRWPIPDSSRSSARSARRSGHRTTPKGGRRRAGPRSATRRVGEIASTVGHVRSVADQPVPVGADPRNRGWRALIPSAKPESSWRRPATRSSSGGSAPCLGRSAHCLGRRRRPSDTAAGPVASVGAARRPVPSTADPARRSAASKSFLVPGSRFRTRHCRFIAAIGSPGSSGPRCGMSIAHNPHRGPYLFQVEARRLP